ncbi:MAG: MMPL family transporter, partial [Acidimicrobiales bacterium]
MFTRLGTFTVRRRRGVLLASAVFLLVAGVLGSGAFGVLRGGGFNDPDSESTKAREILAQEFAQVSADVVAVLTPTAGSVDSTEAETLGTEFTQVARRSPGIVSAVSYWDLGRPDSLRSIDGEHALVLITVDGSLDDDGTDDAVGTLVDTYEQTDLMA